MPPWESGELSEAPRFGWRRLPLLLGPGLVLGASAIGGGEWLVGPTVTARYGGSLLWLATLSILGQVLYNIEISRYTLYSGEPIFTGKFRTLPGPSIWLPVYLILDIGSFLPYLASNAAIPLAAVILGELPDPQEHEVLLKALACVIFITALLPLLFGRKVYSSVKIFMTLKLVIVMGFLLFLAVFYSRPSTWAEIGSGFFKFGNVPVHAAADAPPGEDVENVFVSLLSGRGFPDIDLTLIGFVAAMVAISGNGGLSNAPISNYTRDQGWGMGSEVGAIPSIIGGREIRLSHVGKVFPITQESLRRWRGWCRHVARDQLLVWMPACFIGLALPSMLSVQFLPRGTVLEDKWLAAAMTADGVADAVGGRWGPLFWYLTLFCGFLVLGSSIIAAADGVLRRWVDVFWTANSRLQKWDARHIGRLYFRVLCVYAGVGLLMLIAVKGDRLLIVTTTIYNYALGISCWHTLGVNSTLLPSELRPTLLRRVGLAMAGGFFLFIAVLTTVDKFSSP